MDSPAYIALPSDDEDEASTAAVSSGRYFYVIEDDSSSATAPSTGRYFNSPAKLLSHSEDAIQEAAVSEPLPDYIPIPRSTSSSSLEDDEVYLQATRRRRYFAATAAARRATAKLAAVLHTAESFPAPEDPPSLLQWSNNPPDADPLPPTREERLLLWLPPSERHLPLPPDDFSSSEPLPGEWPLEYETIEARRALVLREIDHRCGGAGTPHPNALKPGTLAFIDGVLDDTFIAYVYNLRRVFVYCTSLPSLTPLVYAGVLPVLLALKLWLLNVVRNAHVNEIFVVSLMLALQVMMICLMRAVHHVMNCLSTISIWIGALRKTRMTKRPRDKAIDVTERLLSDHQH